MGLYFYPLQLPPSPLRSVILERKDQIGWRFKINGLIVKDLWVDSSNECGWRFKCGRRHLVQTSDRLSRSHYGAWHVLFFDWFLSRIKASLRLPCTFPINTRVYLSHFFLFSWNILSEHDCHPCQTALFILLYQPSIHSLRSLDLSIINLLPLLIQKIGKFSLFH